MVATLQTTLSALFAEKAPGIADTTYPSCYYRMVDGVKEWLNPPLASGGVYRTTERRDSKVVYATRFNCGAFPNATYKTFDMSWMGATGVVRSNATMVGSDGTEYTLPYIGSSGQAAYYINVRNTNVYQGAIGNATSYTGYVDIYYTID